MAKTAEENIGTHRGRRSNEINIFVLDTDPELAAKYHCDKHVVKMILETAQILSTALRTSYGISYGYAITHASHPSVMWARESLINFGWLVRLGKELCKEYTFRYNKVHRCQDLIDNITAELFSSPADRIVFTQGVTGRVNPNKFAIAMPSLCKVSMDPVECYRVYYAYHKRRFAKWTKREEPQWYKDLGTPLDELLSEKSGMFTQYLIKKKPTTEETEALIKSLQEMSRTFESIGTFNSTGLRQQYFNAIRESFGPTVGFNPFITNVSTSASGALNVTVSAPASIANIINNGI